MNSSVSIANSPTQQVESLSEIASGLKFSDEGSLIAVNEEHRSKLTKQLKDLAQGVGPGARVIRWFFSTGSDRTIFPASDVKIADWVDNALLTNSNVTEEGVAVRAHNQDQFDYAKMLGSLVTEYEISQKRRTKSQLAALELLKAVAESSGMTQAELAKLLDIEQGTVSKIMSGARSITLDHAKRVARRFKMRPEAFLDLD